MRGLLPKKRTSKNIIDKIYLLYRKSVAFAAGQWFIRLIHEMASHIGILAVPMQKNRLMMMAAVKDMQQRIIGMP